MPKRFRLRLIAVISAVFLATMAVFLAVSFRAERSLHQQRTFEHLDETLGVVLYALRSDNRLASTQLAELEDGLTRRTGIEHRVFVTDPDGRILDASSAELIGNSIRQKYDLHLTALSSSDAPSARYTSDRWLASASALLGQDVGKAAFLMRTRAGGQQFIRQFIGRHGLHVLVTLAAFLAVVQLIGTRYVTRPIAELAAHIESVETGEFDIAPGRDRGDEFSWLADRFTRMGKRLSAVIQKLVRVEKQASAAVVAYRVARDLKEPLHSLDRHIIYLEGLEDRDEDYRRVVLSVRQDRECIVTAIRRLQDVQSPEENPIQGSSRGRRFDGSS
jgi:HAMP domain-containing protein